ncbi:hypothetical protein HHK36_011420 [Tetracentron sinense]|uniref:FAF domain-containing protein n=1 Tax=Tetracentron sinense TaxID=13715 RepID=A0A835DH69_TETSI|nr:hypothetical protein HHK36_011420 [Tetracentron sinense]
MAACGSLQHIFENHLPENPTLIKSLSSWNQIKSMKPIELSFTDIFSELHFKDNPESSSSSSSSSSITDLNPQSEIEKINNNNADNNEKTKNPALDSLLSTQKNQYVGCYKRSDSFSSMNSESLQLCTEGLGFESFDDVEDLKSENSDDWQNHEIEKANIGHNHEREKANIAKYSSPDSPCREFRRLRTKGGDFPPPISCIGRSGKPGVCLKSYRHDGRLLSTRKAE